MSAATCITDLIVEILLRLPPLSVLRFRRVCKQWYTLISNPDFLRTHSSPSSPFQLLVFTKPEHEHEFLVFTKPVVECVPLTQFEEEYRNPPPPSPLLKHLHCLYLPPGGYEFIDACNGLFLFQHQRRKKVANMARTYYIYNPITKYYFKLPDIMRIVKTKGHQLFAMQVNLVFEPSISLTYKVIRVLENSYSRVYWQIYSSETGSWRLLNTTLSPQNYTNIRFGFRSVLLNGVLYWLYSTTRRDVSVNFDVVNECACILPLPPNPEHSFRNCLYLGKCGGRLRLIERFLDAAWNSWKDNPNNLPSSFDIMEMEPAKNQQQQDGVHCTWTVKYRVNIGSVYDLLSKRNASVIHCYRTKNRREYDEEQEVLLLRLNHRSIVSFNLTSKKFIKEIVKSESRLGLCDFKTTFAYTPTLYPLS